MKRALVILALVLPILIPASAAAQDVVSRDGESALLLRDARRLKGLEVTVEVRFFTADDEFLERVGVDFGGAISGQVRRRDQPVENAKVILEVFKVRNEGTPSKRSMSRTGRQAVATDASGRFRVNLRSLIDAEARKEVQDGKVAALVIAATGKNGKRIDFLHLRATTTLGGLIP